MTDTTKKTKPRGPSYYIAEVGKGDAFHWISDLFAGTPVVSRSLGRHVIENAEAGVSGYAFLRISKKHFTTIMDKASQRNAEAVAAGNAGMPVPDSVSGVIYFANVKIARKKTKADIDYDKYDQS